MILRAEPLDLSPTLIEAFHGERNLRRLLLPIALSHRQFLEIAVKGDFQMEIQLK
jgi:hypothetical protein